MFMQKKCANKAGYNSINDLPISIQKEVNIKSRKLALQKREAALSLGISFDIETTASSNATSRLIDKAHNANYLVKMVYVMLSNVNLHLKEFLNESKQEATMYHQRILEEGLKELKKYFLS